MQNKLKGTVFLAAVLGALVLSGCNSGGALSDKDVDAIKHPPKGGMPKEASDAMANPGSV